MTSDEWYDSLPIKAGFREHNDRMLAERTWNAALKNQWMCAEKSLPERSLLCGSLWQCLVDCHEGKCVAFYDFNIETWFSVETKKELIGVTHWMPIPELPK